MNNNELMPYLQDMLIFTQVVDAGSFSEAARILKLDPSAVSRSVSKLEHKLNIQLLQRTTRQLNITENGTKIYQHCKDMLSAAESAILTSQHLNTEISGKIKIYSPRALGKIILHPIIIQFLKKYPKIDITFELDDRSVDLITENIDLEFRITDNPPPEFMGRKLFEIEQILCASQKYINSFGEPTHPQALKQHQCISLSPKMIDTRWRFKHIQKSLIVDITPRYSVNNAEARLEAIKEGIGIGSIPKFMAEQLLLEQSIKQILIDWKLQTNYSGTVWLLYAPSKHLPQKIAVFRDFIIDYLTRLDSNNPHISEF